MRNLYLTLMKTITLTCQDSVMWTGYLYLSIYQTLYQILLMKEEQPLALLLYRYREKPRLTNR